MNNVFPPVKTIKATRFQIARAVLLGRKIKTSREGSTIVGYWYGGVLHVVNCYKEEE